MENTIMPGQKFSVTTTSEFKNGDIVVFNHYSEDYGQPPDESGRYKHSWVKLLFRIAASSGNIIEIKNDSLLVNKLPIPLPPSGKQLYEIKSINPIADPSQSSEQGNIISRNGDTLTYVLGLTSAEVKKYQEKSSEVLSIKKYFFANDNEPDSTFARSSAIDHWNINNYGPLYIAGPNETVNIDEYNYKLYQNIPDIHLGANIIKEKLYFVLGDNRDGSSDSRFIGLIPHSKMCGVVNIK